MEQKNIKPSFSYVNEPKDFLTLNGTSSLKVKRKLEDGNLEENVLYFSKISVDEIFEKRIGNTPGLVLKKNQEYFFTEIPADLGCFGIAKHKCYCNGHLCKKLSAKDDLHGGCVKVRDIPIEAFSKKSKQKLKNACRIEKYDFITEGIESFNTKNNFFIVIECTHYEKSNPPTKPEKKKKKKNPPIIKPEEKNKSIWDLMHF